MAKNSKIRDRNDQFRGISKEIRAKLALSQAELSALLGVSRALLAQAERDERMLPPAARLLLTEMYLQFHELDKGIQSDYRSLETRLLLNDIYKYQIPRMKAREKDSRLQVSRLQEELQAMKQREKNTEHAIIVYTTQLTKLSEQGELDAATQSQATGLEILKQRAYTQLNSCWAPAQVPLLSKIEALRAEARMLRRTRVGIVREHHPFKK